MAPKGPKQRKLLKNKAVVVTSTVNDGTSGNGVKDNGQSTEKTSGGQKRRVAKKKQTSGGDKFDTLAIDTEVPEVKVARRTKQTKLSSAQSQETTGSNSARKKQLLKNGKSQRFKDSETESVHVEIKRCQRQSKTKAKSKITQHFEESCQTQPLSGSALKKAESNVWEEIAGKQRNELGRVRKKMGDSGTVGKWGGNEGGVEEQEEEENETEEATSKTRARKQKGKGGEENKSASCPKAGVKQMKKVGMGENVQKDADYLIEDDKGTEMDVAVSVQETAKGNKYIGAHTSIAGGLCNAVHGAVAIGAKAFGMFLRNQRQWLSKPLKEKDISDFKMALKDFGFSPNMVVPHGSYLMNCGSPSDELLRKSQELLLDELQRCEQLGLVMFNFHPGSTCGEINCSESIQRIADSVNSVHEKTKYVITVLENMCCQGNTIGGRFTELRSIIDLVHDKSRIGVCIDTCHAFAAGYDLSTEEGYIEMMSDLENIIGLKYLKAVHLNDSKGKVGCHLDRHENIGRGHIGLNGFRLMVNDPRFDNIPLVLETPAFVDDSKEVRMLYSLIKV